MDGGSFVSSSQPALISLTVDLNVFLVLGSELLAGLNDDLKTARSAHGLGGVVGMATSSIPISLDGLRVNGNANPEIFSNLVEDEASHPEVISNLKTLAGTNLEFPLSGHDLSVGSADLHSSVEAGLVMSLNNITSKDTISSNTAVVRTLRGGESTFRPSKGVSLLGEEGVFLLKTKPGIVLLGLFEDANGIVARVGLVGGAIRVEAFSHDEDVVSSAEGILEDGNRLDEDVRVLAGGLSGGGTIKVPDAEVADRLGDSV